MKKSLLILITFFLFGCGGGEGEEATAPLKSCSDFAIQEQAQAYFDANGGSASNNFDGLDSDHDGIACENLPHRQNAPAHSSDSILP
jgi:hypothetical protein